MSWHAQLDLNYTVEDARTVLRFAHTGLLRVLQSLYPEGPGVCHNVLVHPPGGLVGGDTLEVHAQVAAGAHALITTPGAMRFYRSEGATALQCSARSLPWPKAPGWNGCRWRACATAPARPKTTSPCNWRPAPKAWPEM